MMNQLKSMKSNLISQIQTQLANIEKADAHELGAAMDMVKDIAMTEYYCQIVKAMEESEKREEEGQPITNNYYSEYRNYPMSREYPYPMDRMYYDMRGYGNGNRGYRENPRDMGGNDRTNYYEGRRMTPAEVYYDFPTHGYEEGGNRGMTHDYRDGRSYNSRRTYMEGKEQHQQKETQLKELEKYMGELSQDMTEMISDASPEEKQLLHKKLSSLANKIELLNKQS